jgi:hypothetical protein
VEVFYIVGGTLAGWALLVSFHGVVRKDFPSTAGAERLVALISIVLVLGAISAAVIGSLNEEHEEDEGGHEEAALVLPAP